MWFFTSDLHGQGWLYEQLLAIGAARRPSAIVIGGDLGPHAADAAGIERQRVFLRGFLVEFARRLREANAATRLMLLMGNDDWASNADCLDEHHGSLWLALHGRVVEHDGVTVAGSSWVPITPFGLKDWERWEDGAEESPTRLDGWVSRDGERLAHAFDPAHRTPTIAQALDALAATAPLHGAVVVSHTPPRDTHFDLNTTGLHFGSRALRAFVERHQPGVVLSGHIHESPRVSSSYHDRIDSTPVVNPGQFGTSRLCGVWFDPARPAETLQHTVYS